MKYLLYVINCFYYQEYDNDNFDSKLIAERVKKLRANLLVCGCLASVSLLSINVNINIYIQVAGETQSEYDMYEELAQNINNEEDEEIDWTDPLASSIISDQSNIVLELSSQSKKLFMVRLIIQLLILLFRILIYFLKSPADNMSPRLRDHIISECQDLISKYNSLNKEFLEKDMRKNGQMISMSKKKLPKIFLVYCQYFQ